jgi:hypothetical protein
MARAGIGSPYYVEQSITTMDRLGMGVVLSIARLAPPVDVVTCYQSSKVEIPACAVSSPLQPVPTTPPLNTPITRRLRQIRIKHDIPRLRIRHFCTSRCRLRTQFPLAKAG